MGKIFTTHNILALFKVTHKKETSKRIYVVLKYNKELYVVYKKMKYNL